MVICLENEIFSTFCSLLCITSTCRAVHRTDFRTFVPGLADRHQPPERRTYPHTCRVAHSRHVHTDVPHCVISHGYTALRKRRLIPLRPALPMIQHSSPSALSLSLSLSLSLALSLSRSLSLSRPTVVARSQRAGPAPAEVQWLADALPPRARSSLPRAHHRYHALIIATTALSSLPRAQTTPLTQLTPTARARRTPPRRAARPRASTTRRPPRRRSRSGRGRGSHSCRGSASRCP